MNKMLRQTLCPTLPLTLKWNFFMLNLSTFRSGGDGLFEVARTSVKRIPSGRTVRTINIKYLYINANVKDSVIPISHSQHPLIELLINSALKFRFPHNRFWVALIWTCREFNGIAALGEAFIPSLIVNCLIWIVHVVAFERNEFQKEISLHVAALFLEKIIRVWLQCYSTFERLCN